jgi:hypothetical protein
MRKTWTKSIPVLGYTIKKNYLKGHSHDYHFPQGLFKIALEMLQILKSILKKGPSDSKSSKSVCEMQ